MPLTNALILLRQARDELRKAQDTDSEEWQGKLTVLETEVGHVIQLAERYIGEMEKSAA